MKIKNKEDIINHFIEGNKLNQYIGIENEKFIFEKNTKKRSSYNQIVSVLNFLIENYDWKPVKENNNLIGLCLLYTSPSPRDLSTSRMPSSA